MHKGSSLLLLYCCTSLEVQHDPAWAVVDDSNTSYVFTRLLVDARLVLQQSVRIVSFFLSTRPLPTIHLHNPTCLPPLSAGSCRAGDPTWNQVHLPTCEDAFCTSFCSWRMAACCPSCPSSGGPRDFPVKNILTIVLRFVQAMYCSSCVYSLACASFESPRCGEFRLKMYTLEPSSR